MKVSSPIAEVEEPLYIDSLRCFRCGLCRTTCPVFEVQGTEDWNTRGRILLLRGLILGEIQLSRSLADRIFSCTLCKKCEVICPSKVNVTRLIQEARFRLVKNGVQFPEAYQKQRENILKFGTVMGRQLSLTSKIPKNVRIACDSSTVFHVGCVASGSYPLIAQLALGVLSRFTPIRTFDSEKCCGGVLLTMGCREDFKSYSERYVREVEGEKIEKIVTLCPMCYNTFAEEYPWKVEVRHTSQVYEELLDSGKLSFTRRIDASVAYHDPCHLGRHAGIYEPPRKVIENIPGVRFVELEFRRELSVCCGGPVRSSYPWIRDYLSEKVVRLAVEAGASYLATACPTCFHNLYSASMLSDSEVKVVMVDELVGFAIGTPVEIPLYKT
ncbi:MAG: (Fe-S)-binding protein [Nitrososphaerota archaeon]